MPSSRGKNPVWIALALAMVVPTSPVAQAQPRPLGSSFTYQGQLRLDDSLADGPYDFRFELHETSTGVDAPLDTACFGEVFVENGLFTVDLDFGAAAFAGERRWLKISVRPGMGQPCELGVYEDLDPLQEITPAPQATFALQAGSALLDQVNDSDASPVNELNRRLELVGGTLELEDAGGVLTVDIDEALGDGYSLDAEDGDPVDALFVDDDGDVGIGTTSAASRLDVRGDVSLNDHELRLRAGTGTRNGLGWYGSTKPFGGSIDPPLAPTIPDGPVLYGNTGGGLGVTQADPVLGLPPPREVLSWRENLSSPGGSVGINSSAPEASLHVVGRQEYALRVDGLDGTPRLLVRGDGGVGIGRNGGDIDSLGTLSVRGISDSSNTFPFIVKRSGGAPIFLVQEDGTTESRGPLDVVGTLQVDGAVDLKSTLTLTGSAKISGDVGIGAASPGARLYVQDSVVGPDYARSSYIVHFRNRATSVGPDVLLLEVDAEPDDRSTNFIQFMAAGHLRGTVENDVDSGLFDDDGVEYTTTGSDFAETLPLADPSEEIAHGDVVGVFGGKISRRTEGADWVMAVSTNPAFIGNRDFSEAPERRLAVAFVGQVHVRVFGPVERDDYIVASGFEDGTAVAVSPHDIRPEQASRIVGRAWESTTGPGESYVRTIVGLPESASTAAALHREIDTVRRETEREVEELEARLARLERRIRASGGQE